MATSEQIAKLREATPEHEVLWRVLRTQKDNELYGECVPYVDARFVFDRLDEVIGPHEWQDDITAWEYGGVKATISILVDGHWVSKSDVGIRAGVSDGRGGTNDEMKIKGDPSDAIKRAAVHWGIGRDLYRADTVWCNLDQWGNILDDPPLTFTGKTQFMAKGNPQKKQPQRRGNGQKAPRQKRDNYRQPGLTDDDNPGAWIMQGRNPGAFLTWASQEHGLDKANVLKALGVNNLENVVMSKGEVIAAIDAYIERQVASDPKAS